MKPTLSFALAAMVLVAGLTGSMLQAESRMWTSADGKFIQAELVDVLNGEAVLKIPGQAAPSRVPFARLSAGDQEFVKQWVKPGAPPAKPAGPAKPAAGKEEADAEILTDATGFPIGLNSTVKRDNHGWPELVALKDKPAFTVVSEDKTKSEFIYRSDHFEFISTEKLSGEIVREFSRLFETTFEAVVALPLRLDPKLPNGFLKVRLYETKAAYFAAGGLEGSAGMYTSRTREVMVPLPFLGVKKIGDRWILEDGDGNTTLIHEVTHQVMNDWLGRLPVWAVEGAAEYVTAGRYTKGRLTLRGHGKNMTEYRHLANSGVETVPLEKLMKMDDQTWANALRNDNAGINYYSAMLLFYYFCHQDGDGTGKGLIDYFAARSKVRNDQDEAHREQFLVRGRDALTMQKDFRKGMASAGIRLQ
jgi:hypothetical protein